MWAEPVSVEYFKPGGTPASNYRGTENQATFACKMEVRKPQRAARWTGLHALPGNESEETAGKFRRAWRTGLFMLRLTGVADPELNAAVPCLLRFSDLTALGLQSLTRSQRDDPNATVADHKRV